MSNYVQMYENPRFPHERQETERLAERLRTIATYKRGVARWNTNNSVIPEDCALFAAHIGMPIDLEKTARVRDREDRKFLAAYRKARKNYVPSPEEQFEMDAAFGPGEKIVDAITGKYIYTTK